MPHKAGDVKVLQTLVNLVNDGIVFCTICLPSARVAIYVLLRHGTVVVQEAFKWPHTVSQLRLQVAAVCVKSCLVGSSNNGTVYSLVTFIGLKGHDHKHLSMPLYRHQH